MIIIFLIIGGGLRGIVDNGIYLKWTNNPWEWSLNTFTDYFVSTTLFTIRGLNMEPDDLNLSDVRDELGENEIKGYTNIERYLHVYKTFGFWSFIYLIGIHFFMELYGIYLIKKMKWVFYYIHI
mgnify:CR=1 FL=1